MPKNPVEWDVDHIVAWANLTFNSKEGRTEITSFLKDQKVNGEDLFDLNDAMLEKMGLSLLLLRKRLLKAIATLKETSA